MSYIIRVVLRVRKGFTVEPEYRID